MTLTQSEKIGRDIFGGIEDLYLPVGRLLGRSPTLLKVSRKAQVSRQLDYRIATNEGPWHTHSGNMFLDTRKTL